MLKVSDMLHTPPLRLILSGGGIRGISYIGVFLELERVGFLKNVKEILGVSCGALFGFAYSIGYSPKELLELVEVFDFRLIQNIDPEIMFRFFETYGMDDMENLQKLLVLLLKNKGYEKEVTFMELYEKTKFTFRCFATNVNSCSIKEFSYKTTPTKSVCFGILSSMCLPGYFIPCREDNILYVDGALINNYPIDVIDEKDLKDTLGFIFSNYNSSFESIQNLLEYFNQLLNSYNSKISKNMDHTIIIPCDHIPIWNFAITLEEKLELVNIGKKSIVDYFQYKTIQKPIRRYSVS